MFVLSRCFTYVMVAGWEVLSWACQQAMFTQQQKHTYARSSHNQQKR